MESHVNASPEQSLQDKIGRAAEGVLMLGATLTGLWLLGVLVYSFMQ